MKVINDKVRAPCNYQTRSPEQSSAQQSAVKFSEPPHAGCRMSGKSRQQQRPLCWGFTHSSSRGNKASQPGKQEPAFAATLRAASTRTITAAGNGVPHRWSTTFSRQQSDSEIGYNTQNRVLLKWHIPFSMAEDGSHDEFTDAGNQSSGHTDGSPFAALPQHVRVLFPRSICHF